MPLTFVISDVLENVPLEFLYSMIALAVFKPIPGIFLSWRTDARLIFTISFFLSPASGKGPSNFCSEAIAMESKTAIIFSFCSEAILSESKKLSANN